MKKMFTQNNSVLRLLALTGFIAGCVLLTNVSYGQAYFSNFPDPAGKYGKTDPAGCGAPAIQNIESIADNNASNFASFEAVNIAAPFTCNDTYRFDVDLKLPSNLKAVPAGSQAGFRLDVPTGINKDSLGKYLKVTTFLRDSVNPNNVAYQEFSTGGGGGGNTFYGLDIFQTGVSWAVYFTATKPFNLLELSVDPKIIQLGVDFRFNVFYAFGGSLGDILPAQIANFKAVASGKNVSISWQSLTETNVSSYRVERSGNGGTSYSVVASVPAKGNSNTAISYGYNDNVAVDGNYLYRIVVVNQDGSSKATSSVAVIISGQGKLIIYPTVVKAGQNITVKTSENGMVSVFVYDAQGRMVKQQRTNSTGQFNISTNNLSSGVYTIKIVSATGNTVQSRIVIN